MKNNVLFIVVPTVDEGHSDDAESSCCYSDIDSMDEEEMCNDPDWLPPSVAKETDMEEISVSTLKAKL